MYTETITQRQAVANGVPPQQINNATVNTGAVDMQQSHRAFFTAYVGANSGSISLWLQESADNATWPANGVASSFANSGGSNVSQTAITGTNKIVTFEVRADQLTAGKRYVRLQVQEVNSQNCQVAVTAVGDEGNHKPNNANNGTQVQTQNVVA